MKRSTGFRPWMIGLLTASALLAALSLWGGLRYENSDDILFVKGFLGFEGGIPVSFTLYTHTFLAWLLYGLSVLVPRVAWFSVFQVGLLWLSVATMMKCALRMRRWAGMAACLLYLGVFAAFACARVSYTTTAALAGAAAVMQLMECETAVRRAPGLAWAALLLLAAYSLRQMVVLPVLAYALLALGWQGLRARQAHGSMRPALLSAAVLCALVLAFAGVREWEITARGQRDALAWQQSRIELFDYTSFEQDIAPALEAETGLTAKQTRLVQSWYFWDEAIDADVFRVLREGYRDEAREDVFSKLGSFFAQNPRYGCAVLFLAALLLWILLGDRKPRSASLAAALAALGGLALLLYLCWRGRVLFRGLDTVLFPCGALLLGLALRVEAPGRKAAAAICAAAVLAAGADGLLTLDILKEKPDWVSQQREDELERFALSHPDKLIARDPNLLRDTRLFPDVGAGVPANTIIWGDWYCRMPGWHQQMRAFGLDEEHFTLADWTNSALVFATVEDAPPDALLEGVSEALGREARAELFGAEGTLRFYQLR